MVRTLHVVLDDETYELLVRMKGDLTWKEFLKAIAKGKFDKSSSSSSIEPQNDLEVRISRIEEQIKALTRQVNELYALLSAKREKELEKVEDEVKPATEKQIKYIWTLMKRLGITVTDVKNEFGVDLANVSLEKEILPRDIASEIINWLKEKEKEKSSEEKIEESTE